MWTIPFICCHWMVWWNKELLWVGLLNVGSLGLPGWSSGQDVVDTAVTNTEGGTDIRVFPFLPTPVWGTGECFREAEPYPATGDQNLAWLYSFSSKESEKGVWSHPRLVTGFCYREMAKAANKSVNGKSSQGTQPLVFLPLPSLLPLCEVSPSHLLLPKGSFTTPPLVFEFFSVRSFTGGEEGWSLPYLASVELWFHCAGIVRWAMCHRSFACHLPCSHYSLSL